MDNPLISIIIPTFNRAHLIGETLDSVMTQTYQNWECIIVDDGSTDNSQEIIGNYIRKDKRFQFVYLPEGKSKGGNAARNYGLELSIGEFVNFFDSDDLMDANKLKKQIESLLQNGDKDFILCQTAFFQTDIAQIESFWNINIFSEYPAEDFIIKKIGWSILAPLWKKESLIRNNLKFDEELKNGQDFKFHMEVLFKNLKPIISNDNLVFARTHKNQIKSNINKGFSKMLIFKFLYHNKLKLNKTSHIFIVTTLTEIVKKLYKEKKALNAFSLSLFLLKNEFSTNLLFKIVKYSFYGTIYYIFGRGISFLIDKKF